MFRSLKQQNGCPTVMVGAAVCVTGFSFDFQAAAGSVSSAQTIPA